MGRAHFHSVEYLTKQGSLESNHCFDVMDAPWKPGNVWPLQLLVRRRIQELLQRASKNPPNTVTPKEHAKLLPLPPLLVRIVLNDAIICDEDDWDHLALTSQRPQHVTEEKEQKHSAPPLTF